MRRPTRQRAAFLLGPEQVEVRQIPVPEPGPGELLVKIAAATTCGTDVKVFRRGGHPRMIHPPSPFGHEMAGVVAAAGPGVARFREGDAVVIANSAPCGLCEACARERENLCRDLAYLNGAFAQYVLVPPRFTEKSTYKIPGGLPFQVAALAEPLACVLHALEQADLSHPGDAVLYGSGPIGLLFLSVLVGAGHRVAVADPNPSRLAIARKLGAAATLPVGRDGGEAARLVAASEAGDGYDLAIEATGSPAAWWDALNSARPGGTVLLFGGCPPGTAVPLDTHRLHYSEITVKSPYHHRPPVFRQALDKLAADEIPAHTLLSAELPLARVEEALRRMIGKEALKVVIRP